ncbi:MAG: FIG01161751: hypothetical protein, partial [uncultured Ramlibacter sp.]
ADPPPREPRHPALAAHRQRQRRGRLLPQPVAGARPGHRAAAEDREPVLLRQERRPQRRPAAAEGDPGRRADLRRDRRRHRGPALPQRRRTADRSALRVPRLHQGSGARPQRSPGRPAGHGADPREAAGPHRLRQGQDRGQDCCAARTAPAQRVPDERGQHPARRRRAGGAALHRAAGAAVRQLPVRLSDGRGPALQQPAIGAGRCEVGGAAGAPGRAGGRGRLRPQGRHHQPDRPEGSAQRHTRRRGDRARRAARQRGAGAGRAARQPRLHPRLPVGRRAHRGRRHAVPGCRRELLPGDGGAAQAHAGQRDQPARVHLRGRHLRLHARLPAADVQGAAARADWQPEAERQLQRAAVLRQQPLPGAALGPGDARQHRAGGAHHRADGRRWQHRADPGPQARVRRAESGRRRPHRGGRHRRLRHRGARGLRAGAAQPVAGQRVRLRHRQLGQPAPDGGPGTRRHGRALHHHQALRGAGAGRPLPQDDRVAGAHQRAGALRRPGCLRRRAQAPARRAGRAAGDRVRQVARRGARPGRGRGHVRAGRLPQRPAGRRDAGAGHGRPAPPLGPAPHRSPVRPGGAGGRRCDARGDHRARPALQPADAVHQFPGGRPGRAQCRSRRQRGGRPAFADAAGREQPRGRRRSARHAGARHLGRRAGAAVGAGDAGAARPPQQPATLHRL